MRKGISIALWFCTGISVLHTYFVGCGAQLHPSIWTNISEKKLIKNLKESMWSGCRLNAVVSRVEVSICSPYGTSSFSGLRSGLFWLNL